MSETCEYNLRPSCLANESHENDHNNDHNEASTQFREMSSPFCKRAMIQLALNEQPVLYSFQSFYASVSSQKSS